MLNVEVNNAICGISRQELMNDEIDKVMEINNNNSNNQPFRSSAFASCVRYEYGCYSSLK
ncbi:hypothetical protein HQN84_15560 [Pedobacter steynii]|uniref:hypothetical protein n=1 Tax=Pedobacter steynii TaxID=430522 RepID=UPI0009442F17|nr:hypothetical protein [Pedobacter steynii]NQX40272.1 hypothetical protein [Pedobacter steynii]